MNPGLPGRCSAPLPLRSLQPPLEEPDILSTYYMPGAELPVCIISSCLEGAVSRPHFRDGITEAQPGAATCP